jgi:hypothetical protein
MLARLPKPALASNQKVLPSIGAFSRTMSAPGEGDIQTAEQGAGFGKSGLFDHLVGGRE